MTMKKALVTGASRGLGKAVADKLIAEGFDVYRVARTGDVEFKGDLRDQAFRRHIMDAITPDLFINNAGLLSGTYDDVMGLNFVAAGHLLSHYYHAMPEGSDIINIASVAANRIVKEGDPDYRVWYTSSKHAIKSLSTSLHLSRKRDVRVMCLEPGWINTDILTPIVPDKRVASRIANKERAPMPTAYYADMIWWCYNQPRWLNVVSFELDQHWRIDHA